MIVFLLILTITLRNIVLSYNLDIMYPLVFEDPSKTYTKNLSYQSSYFGFSVHIVPEFGKLEPTLIIGAPRGNLTESRKFAKEPGLAYQCSIFGKCHAISPTRYSSSDIAIKQIGMYAKIIQDNGWFGTSIAALHPSIIKICAPRTKIDIFKPFTNISVETTQGMCYFYFRSNDTPLLQLETESLTTYNFRSPHWYNPQYGFSQYISTEIPSIAEVNFEEKNAFFLKSFLENVSIIVGNPTYRTTGSVNIVHKGQWKTITIPNYGHEQAEFGYSVTGGYYFGKNEILFASGAPTWNFIGKVAVIRSSILNASVILQIHGEELGNYFGASLTSGDLNGDGFDDLVVGAPHYGNDNGKVYIYLGTDGVHKILQGFLDTNPVLEGSIMGSQFGYSLSCGDLDNDSYLDLVIGAPWEENGVVYVFNGHSMLSRENPLQVSQKIRAKSIFSELRGFGFSISNFADADGNGFVDVAFGAYKSGHVVLLRTKPVEKTELNFTVQPTILKNITQKISPEFCLKNYKSSHADVIRNYTVKIVIDSKHERYTSDDIVWNFSLNDKNSAVFQFQYSRQPKPSRIDRSHWNGCITSHFFAKTEIQNSIDPVDINLTFNLNSYQTLSPKNNTTPDKTFCKHCPILYQGRESKPIKSSVAFEIDCVQNTFCKSDISVTTSVHGLGQNNVWEIGSGDISIEAKFQNHGEPAYLVTANFVIPKGIHLRKVWSFCQEEMSENLIMVTCNVASPLIRGSQKVIRLDLDMRQFEIYNLTDVVEKKLTLNVIVKSHTYNHGLKNISIPLILKSNLSVAISGKTDDEIHYVTDTEQKETRIAFRHTYNIFKLGATRIAEGHIKIEVPTSINYNQTFIVLKEAQFEVGGLVHKCANSGIQAELRSGPNLMRPSSDSKRSNDSFENDLASASGGRGSNKSKDTFGERSESKDFSNILESKSILIDCLNDRIYCGFVVCDLASLKSSGGVGTVTLDFFLKLDPLKAFLNGRRNFQLRTNAQIILHKPLNYTTERELVSTFHGAEKAIDEDKRGWRIITLSVFVGLLISSIIASALYYIGFFQKRQKFELLYLRRNSLKDTLILRDSGERPIVLQDDADDYDNEPSNF